MLRLLCGASAGAIYSYAFCVLWDILWSTVILHRSAPMYNIASSYRPFLGSSKCLTGLHRRLLLHMIFFFVHGYWNNLCTIMLEHLSIQPMSCLWVTSRKSPIQQVALIHPNKFKDISDSAGRNRVQKQVVPCFVLVGQCNHLSC